METEFGVRPARYKQEKRKQRRIVRPEELLTRTIPEPEKPTPPAPKFKEAKRKEEAELRAKGVPEEQVEVIAPRLATAVWLENQIRALKESSMIKITGGVPASELRTLKEKILAKKHVVEKAMELVEKRWMKGNIEPLTEMHLDSNIISLVKEHASDVLGDIKVLTERVKKGEVSAAEAKTLLLLKLVPLYRTLEAISKLLGNPEHLFGNRKAWGAEDRFLVRKGALERLHEEVKLYLLEK